MPIEPHTIWTSLAATLAQEGTGGANPLFNQANPSAPGAPSASGTPLQGQPGATGAPGAGPAPASGPPVNFLVIMGVILVVMILLPALTTRKQEKKRKAMLGAMKKHDRVVTLGGMIGTIAEIREDEGEVVLKVDDHSNTKIRFTKSAIQQVLRPSAEVEIPKAGETLAARK